MSTPVANLVRRFIVRGLKRTKAIPFVAVIFVGFAASAHAQSKTKPVIFLPPSLVTFDYVHRKVLQTGATGTWFPDGNGVMSTHMDCFRGFFCVEATAILSAMKQPAVNLDYYRITRWDVAGLSAYDDSPICVVNTLHFDFASQTVTSTRTLKKDLGKFKDDPFCKAFFPPKTTHTLGGALHENMVNSDSPVR